MLALACGCSSPAEGNLTHEDASVEDGRDHILSTTDGGPVLPCVSGVMTVIDDDGGVHNVTFPCLSGGSTSRGTSDPAGWGNDGYEPSEQPGTDFVFPPRTPPGDPSPF